MTFQEKLKAWVNKTPIPSLLSFFINPKAKDPMNPTWEEVKATAPDPSKNWARLGLDKLTSFGQPVWKLFLIVAAVLAVYFGANALKFSIDVIANFGVVAVLAVVLWWIYSTFVKK